MVGSVPHLLDDLPMTSAGAGTLKEERPLVQQRLDECEIRIR
jgi:hypothetical protein